MIVTCYLHVKMWPTDHKFNKNCVTLADIRLTVPECDALFRLVWQSSAIKIKRHFQARDEKFVFFPLVMFRLTSLMLARYRLFHVVQKMHRFSCWQVTRTRMNRGMIFQYIGLTETSNWPVDSYDIDVISEACLLMWRIANNLPMQRRGRHPQLIIMRLTMSDCSINSFMRDIVIASE
jgi:hypothetical protein